MTATRRHVFAVGLLVSCAAWASIRASIASGEIVIMDDPTAMPTPFVGLGLPPGLRLETTCPKWLPQPCLAPALSAMPHVPAFGPPGFGRLTPLGLSDGLRLGLPWAKLPGLRFEDLRLASEPWRRLAELDEGSGAVWDRGTTLSGMPAHGPCPPIRFEGESRTGLTCVPYQEPVPLFEDLSAGAVVSQPYPSPRPAPLFPRISIRGYSR